MNPRNSPPTVTDQDDTPLMGGDLDGPGTGFCQRSVRYEQGRWFARFALRLVVAIITIIVLAAVVAGVIAMCKGVQG